MRETMANKTQYPSRELEQVNLRIPEYLKEKIEASAREAGRSMNTEISQRLIASFEPSKQIYPVISELLEKMISDEVTKRLQAIATQIAAA